MGGSQKCLRIQEDFAKYVLYQICCLSCQWKSWLQDLETIKIVRNFKRNLTILGKIMITKALVIHIFTCVASACVVQDKYRKEIESKCFKFI